MLDKLKQLKDKGLAATLKATLNEKYRAYGRVLEVSIDSKAKTLKLFVELYGEDEGIEVELTNYKVFKSGDITSLQIGPIKTSRTWMTALLNDLADLLPGKRDYEIENIALAKLIRTLL